MNIDYDKLKLAHEKAGELPFDEWEVRHTYGKPDNYYVLTFTDDQGLWNEDCYKSLDELIAKITELTQPKPNYQAGTTWWYLDGAAFERFPEPKSLLITEENKNWFRADEEWYPTKSELIEAQIEYWQSLHDGVIAECQKEIIDTKDICSHGEFRHYDCSICFPEKLRTRECQHECKWDGTLVSKSPNMGRCRICKKICYVAIDHDKWLKGECETTRIEQCQHESKKIYKYSDYCINPPVFECLKCGEFYR